MATQTAIPRIKPPVPKPADADADRNVKADSPNGRQVKFGDAALELADAAPKSKPSAPKVPVPGANGHPVMYSDGLPSLDALDKWYINYIYPPSSEPMPGGIPHQEFFLTIAEFFSRLLGLMGITALTLGDVNIYYLDKSGRLASVAPDACVILGVNRDEVDGYESYFVEAMGKPPDLVFEIASPSTAKDDLVRKRETYARIAVPEYWMADPTGGKRYGFPLLGLKLVDGEYAEIEMEELPDGGARGYSEVLQTYLYFIDGEIRLRNPIADEWLRSPLDETKARIAAEARAEAAEARADEAEAEIAALRERLRQLGLPE